jgi:hypothetical protein
VADVFVLDWAGNILWTAYVPWDLPTFGTYSQRRAISADKEGNVYVLASLEYAWPLDPNAWVIVRIDKPKVLKSYYSEDDPDRPRVKWEYHKEIPDTDPAWPVDIKLAVDIAVGRDGSDDPGLFVVDSGYLETQDVAHKIGLASRAKLWTGTVWGSTPFGDHRATRCDVTGEGHLHVGCRSLYDDAPTVKNYFIWNVNGGIVGSYRIANTWKTDGIEITSGVFRVEAMDKHSTGASGTKDALAQDWPYRPEGPFPLSDYIISAPAGGGWYVEDAFSKPADIGGVAGTGLVSYWAGYHNWNDADIKYVHWLHAINGPVLNWSQPLDGIAENNDLTLRATCVECTTDRVAVASTAHYLWRYGQPPIIPTGTFIRGYAANSGAELWRTKLHHAEVSSSTQGIIDTDHRNGLIYALANGPLVGDVLP